MEEGLDEQSGFRANRGTIDSLFTTSIAYRNVKNTKSMSSQVKLLITNNAFCIVQRATAQSKTGIFRDFGVAEAPPGFQAGWSDCMYFFLSLSAHLAR
jgi:hypothetical protein